jgi:hypothetical protein
MKKILMYLVLGLLISCGNSVTKFNKEKDTRFTAVIENLKEIRKAEIAYKDVYGEYADNFEKLICFVKNDSLFTDDYNLDAIRYVPFTDNAEFKLKAGKFKTMSGVIVPVFEASVTNDILLHGLNKKLLINLNDEKLQINHFPGLKVGDVNAANNNAGNWE